MTNLIILAITVITNFVQVRDAAFISTNDNGLTYEMRTTNAQCCIQRDYEMGLSDGTYLFTVTRIVECIQPKLDSPYFDPIGFHHNAIYIDPSNAIKRRRAEIDEWFENATQGAK